MAYDEELAGRVRTALGDQPFTEQRMFGGLSFLVAGHLAVAAGRDGGLLVHVAPGEAEALLAQPGVAPARSGGRTMRGWVRVDADHLPDRALASWVRRGVAHATSRP